MRAGSLVDDAIELGSVVQIWRYPVKSLRGERLARARVGRRGIEGDRRWAVRGEDGALGSGKTTRRFRRMPGLLELAAELDDSGIAWVTTGAGERRRVDDPATAEAISAVVGEPVDLVAERPLGTPHLDDAPLHLLTTASLAWLADRVPDSGVDAPRFRPNLVVACEGAERAGSALVEEGWIGRRLQIGEATVRVVARTVRCVMPSLAQGELSFAPQIVGELERANERCLGVYAAVETEGELREGDPVRGVAS